MITLEFWSGVGLLVLAAGLLSPYWWPPLWNEIHRITDNAWRSGNAFLASAPGRWTKALSHWRGAEDYRRKAAIFSLLCLAGIVWLVWVHRTDTALPEPSRGFTLLFFGIGLGSMSAGFAAAYYAFQTARWVWEGFRAPRPPSLPVANPMNRVGRASPLGEAGFATAREVDTALANRGGHFVPPKFRE